LFHLLIEDAASRWDGSGEARSGLERAFTHGSMKQASLQFRQPVWQDWHGRQQPIPLAVQRVASIFVDLQEERHTADYDNHEQWSVTEVQTTLNMAHTAFVEWKSVRSDPVAGNYLLAMLVKKQR